MGGTPKNNGNVFTYPGGSDDDFGTDDGSRELPGELAAEIVRFQGNVDVQGIFSTLRAEDPTLTSAEALAQAQQLNRALGLTLNRNIGLEEKDPHPDIGLKANIGNRFDLGSDLDLGFMVGGSYDTDWRESTAISRSFQFPDERTDTELESTRSVNISGNLNLGLRYTDDHTISTTSLFLRNTDDETAIRDFFNENREISDGIGFRNYRFQFEERNLMVNQIKGSHYLGEATRERIGGLAGLIGWLPLETQISWFSSESRARTDIPGQVDVDAQTISDPASGEVLSAAVTLDATAADYRYTGSGRSRQQLWLGGGDSVHSGTLVDRTGPGVSSTARRRALIASRSSASGALSVADSSILGGPLDSVFTDQNVLDPANNYVFDLQGTTNQSYLVATMTDAVLRQRHLDVR